MQILGVKVDKINLDEATNICLEWLKGAKKHYVVTTNVEFIIRAQGDQQFKEILNGADLSIPDSARLGWAANLIHEKSLVKKILKWPLFLSPNWFKKDLPVTPGVDLMERLIKLSEERGFRIGLLGGKLGVAEKTVECLKRRYPNLKINFINSGGNISEDGEQIGESRIMNYESSSMIPDSRFMIPKLDILFVAFGAPKQEKWIKKNMGRVDSKLFIGVGGSFDYLSGEVSRAPKLWRNLGLEWLYRLFQEPWRIKRFGSLVEFVFKVLG